MPARTLALTLLAILLGGCSLPGSSSGAQPTPTANSAYGGTMQLHLAYLQARELTPDRRLVVPLGRGNTLYVFHSVCSGSADGHCGEVDAFFDAGRDPVFDHQYPTMQRMEAIPGGFSITARSFKTTDPLCCPSGPTVTDRYAWHGGKLSRRGASQNEPGS